MRSSSDNNKKEKTSVTNLLDGEKASIKKRALFAFSNSWNRKVTIPLNKQDCWTAIIPHLYLGVIPTKDDAASLINMVPNLKLVVSAVESFEFKGNQTPADWANEQIDQHQLPIPDHSIDVDPVNVYVAVQKIRAAILRGEDVYVHCKAGKSRSATIVLAYLAVYECGPGLQWDETTPLTTLREYLLEKRPQVDLKLNHFDVVNQVLAWHRAGYEVNLNQAANDNDVLKGRLNAFFSDIETKRTIANLGAIKMLKVYADKKPGKIRAQIIYDFLKQISSADNADWFIETIGSFGKMQELLKTNPQKFIPFAEKMKIGLAVERAKLVADLKEELLVMTTKYIDLDMQELDSIIHESAYKKLHM